MTMPNFATHLALAQMDLGPFVAKPTSIEGNQSEASVDLWTTHPDGTVQAFGPGDAITLPQGWKGVWRVVEQVRKIYVITQG